MDHGLMRFVASAIVVSIMETLVLCWIVNAACLIVSYIILIPPIKRRTKKVRWCKQLRVFYFRRRCPMAEY